jgi:hypothetical protein
LNVQGSILWANDRVESFDPVDGDRRVKALRLREGAAPRVGISGEARRRGEGAPGGSEIGTQLDRAKLRFDRFDESTGDEMAKPDRREVPGLCVVSRAQAGGHGKFVEAVSRHAAVTIGASEDDMSERQT